MDASRFSRWTRFAKKGGIGKCVALQDCVAELPGDLMFFKNDEITVLMQIPEEDGIYLGYCEGVVGRFAAAHVHFNGKLKTMVISKRSSSTSKSPRPRSLTPSHRRQASQSPTPSLSRASSHEDVSSHGHSSSLPPSVPVPNPPVLGHPHGVSETSSRSDASAESSHQDLLATPPVSYSSSSSVQESASPPTPLESYAAEPLLPLRDKTRPFAFSGTSENGRLSPYNTTYSLRQNPEAAETLPSSEPAHTLPPDILGIMQARSLSSDLTAPTPPLSPQPPSPSPHGFESSDPRQSIDDAGGSRLSRLSAATSDDAAGIGLSMLQGFISGNLEDEDEEDEDEDGDEGRDESDHDFSSQSERERTSLEETVDGFPAPPTQIPTPSSRATSFVLDAHRPISSSTSEYSEDGDGASFYDNYRYSRLSISSKMSKSSGYTAGTVPPPIPTELLPPVGHSQDFQDPAPPSSQPLLSPSETPSFSSQPREVSQPTATQGTRTLPPPLILKISALGPEPSGLVTPPVTSSSPHTTFGSPKLSPHDSISSTTRSPITATFNPRGSGAASALRQQIESYHGISSPLASPMKSTMSDEPTLEQSQSIVVEDKEDVPGYRGTQPQSSTSRPPSPLSPSSTTPEKKKRRGPPPLVVMNPAPPPPYTPTSPQSSGPFPTFTAVPTPSITYPPSQAVPEPATNVSARSPFLPHPNAPKPNLSPQGILYGRPMAPMLSPPSTFLIQAMCKAIQMRVTPSGLPRFSTIYGSTTQDLSTAPGPVLIHFSVDPPTDIPARRVALTPAPPQTPVSISTQNTLSPPEAQQLPTMPQVATSNVIPRASFIPKAKALRPRSRSFSGFDSPTSAGVTPKEQSKRTTNTRPSTTESAPSSHTGLMATRAAAHTARIHQARQYTPSPLSTSQTSAKTGTSPSGASVPPPPAHLVASPTSPTFRRTLVPMKSEPSLRAGPPRSSAQERETPPQPTAKPDAAPLGRVRRSSSNAAINAPSIQISHSDSQVLLARDASGNEPPFSRKPSAGSLPPKPSMDIESSRASTSASAPSAPLGRSGSLRSKISLSALRAKSLRDDDGLHDGDTVQVMDTDFELVRPTRTRVSEDSSINTKGSGGEGRPSFLRVDSPAASTTSGGTSDTRSPVSPSAMSLPPMTAVQTATNMGAVEAHRARELKWLSVMSSTPSSHARKSKKIRKLLQDGVPASVRYQVWAHLTDSRAKRIEGLYAQLGDREKVPAFTEIQRDAHLCFSGDARLSQPNGPLVSLLQAYLTMVPDVQYCKGLAFIAGHLLLQSPEEDAFWIFISLMDSHLRPYFSSNAIQLDIDASLFAKAIETVDPTIAKKLFTAMGIAPIRVCRPWFSSLFAEALPTEYFQRVWDIFLSEGTIFLFRVGLAIVTCCHRTLLGIHQEADALNLLTRPPPFLISSSPDLFIELANSFRLKDDDIRKQRAKLEAQVKVQTQNRLPSVARRSSGNAIIGGVTTSSISLPRS